MKFSVLLVGCVCLAAGLCQAAQPFPGEKSDFQGFTMYHDAAAGRRIVAPKQPASGRPWIWRARFWGHEPQFDRVMLERGWHIAFCDVGNLFGSPQAVAIGDKFYADLVQRHGLAARPVLEGMSRGGLFIYNWAAANPDKVTAIYGDAPVLDFTSWPGGKQAGKTGPGAAAAWKACLKAYGLNHEQALASRLQPLDRLAPLAAAEIPIIHVVGDADQIVPVAENTAVAEQRYRALGGTLKVIHKAGVGHHPHSLADPAPIVTFVLDAWNQQSREQPAAAVEQPNLIFILSDDIAQGDVGAYGQTLIKTPNLDRLCAEGTRYLAAYTGTSVCAPARSSFFTGLHSGHCPIRGNREIKPEGQKPLPAGLTTVGTVLKSAGYATATMGKWGMGMFDTSGSPFQNGIDHFFGYNCQRHAHSYFPPYLYNDADRVEIPENVGGKKRVYAQELIQQEVLRWVDAHSQEPFFLFYAITLPHGRYEIDDQGSYKNEPWSEQEKNYAAMVSRLDSDVGELVELLERKNIADNTLIVFAGDNGSSFAPRTPIGKRFDQTMGGKLRGFKRGMYEGGLRQAAFAWWPGTVPAGRVTDEPWAFWDLLPTFAELAGADLPPGFTPDGLSLVDFLKGASAPRRESFYWELHEGRNHIQAIRWGNWKAVRPKAGGAVELYDLADDLGETNDLAQARPDLVERAISMMNASRTVDPAWPDPANR